MRILIIMLLTFSCSFKSVLVSKLDYIITKKISDSFDLNDGQEERLRKDIKLFLNENRTTAKEIKANIAKVDSNKPSVLKALKKNYLEISEKFIPILARQFSLLSTKQKEDLLNREREKNDNIIKKNERMTLRSICKKYSQFFGYINDKQKLIIKSNFSMIKEMSSQRVERRILIQNRLSQAKSSNEAAQAFKLYIKTLSMNKEQENRLFKFFTDLLSASNEDQKKIIEEKKNEIIEVIDLIVQSKY